MEGRKQIGSSSSSLTSELFGSNDSHLSSTSGIFESIFSPSHKVFGKESLRSEESNSKFTTNDNIRKGNVGESYSRENKDMSSSNYQEQRVQPCHLSSSIYYGGQDIYSQPHTTHDSGFNSMVVAFSIIFKGCYFLSSSSNMFIFLSFYISTRKMGEKMIQEVLQEETGGKDLYIIKT